MERQQTAYELVQEIKLNVRTILVLMGIEMIANWLNTKLQRIYPPTQ